MIGQVYLLATLMVQGAVSRLGVIAAGDLEFDVVEYVAEGCLRHLRK